MAIKDTKTVTLYLSRKALVYDIENYAFIEGDIMQTDDEHVKHQVFDIAQDGNVDRVSRVLNLAYDECVELLYPYTKRDIGDWKTCDNGLSALGMYEIEMEVPNSFAESTVNLISKLIHEYMVCRVLADWMSITNPKAQQSWMTKVEDLKKAIRQCVNHRRVKVRRRLSVF